MVSSAKRGQRCESVTLPATPGATSKARPAVVPPSLQASTLSTESSLVASGLPATSDTAFFTVSSSPPLIFGRVTAERGRQSTLYFCSCSPRTGDSDCDMRSPPDALLLAVESISLRGGGGALAARAQECAAGRLPLPEEGDLTRISCRLNQSNRRRRDVSCLI